MEITAGFIRFLREAKGNLVHFISGKAVSVSGKIVQYFDVSSSELDGITVDRRELFNTVSVLDGHIGRGAEEVWVCKDNKRKAVSFSLNKENPIFDSQLVKQLDVDFYERYVKAATYASTDTSRHFLCGVYLDNDGTIVGTDGKALIAWKADKRFANANRNIIYYDKMLSNLKIASVEVYDTHIEFVTKNSIVYQVPFIRSQYPNYRRLLDDKDSENSNYAPVELKKEIIESLIIAQKFVKNDRFRQVLITDKYIKTVGDQPYVDDIELGHEINIRVNVEYLNKCIADVDASLGNMKFLHYSDTKHTLVFEDDRKVLLLMQMTKEY